MNSADTGSGKMNYKNDMLMIEVTVEHQKNLFIMHLDGKLYFENLDNVIEIWKKIVSKKPSVIAMNCKELDGIDSSSIGTLVQFFNEAMKKEIKLVFYDLNPAIRKLFRTIHLEQFFTVTTGKKFVSRYCNFI